MSEQKPDWFGTLIAVAAVAFFLYMILWGGK